MELHLVPDTNLFFEFKALEQLPWEELGHDPIVLLLTKPVLDEIDRHKKGTGRTRDRALDIYGRFRGMLEAGLGDSEIRASGPKVVLRRMTTVPLDPDLKEQLDYDKADERLIGIVSTLNKRATGHEVKLFTDDGGPAGMAQDLGVPFKMIDRAWRRPPAETTEAKQIRELKKDLAAYRDQEPKIAIRCETADADGLVRVVGKAATPLNEPEVDGLIEALRLKHPLRSDFTPPPTKTTTDTFGETTAVEYAAPADDEIANYRDVRYPGWVEKCRETLRNVHVGRDEEAPPVLLRCAMCNDGSRPALRVRIEFETAGELALLRPKTADDDEDAKADDQSTPDPALRLPPAPKPPAFREHVTREAPPATPPPSRGVPLSSLRGVGPLGGYERAMSAAEMLGIAGRFPDPASAAMKRLQDSIMGVSGLDAVMRGALDPTMRSALDPTMRSIVDPIAMPVIEPIRGISLHQFRRPEPPKPEEFLYADWPTGRPVQKGAFSCQMWRHRTGDEKFECEVLFGKDGDARGVVECTVHADNLTTPQQAKVIVERKIEVVGMLDLAKAMVEACG
jgi:hypothetical protein